MYTCSAVVLVVVTLDVVISVVRFGSFVFFFKQKTAYEMRISDWSSDVCSSDLFKAWYAFSMQVGDSGIEKSLLELVKIRASQINEIGRASCRERVCQYV